MILYNELSIEELDYHCRIYARRILWDSKNKIIKGVMRE